MRAALYTRVSTREQAQEGYSIAAQLNSLKSFCESQSWDIVGIYTDDGISAKDTKRTQLQRMISDLKGGKIDVVLVYRLDRLTRSVLDLYALLELFEEHNCGFKSATEVYDTTTAMGRLFITIVAALAQWERENLGERIAVGMLEKARQGEFPGGVPPFGFDLKDSKLTVNKEEAKTVKLIFDKYLSGYSMTRLTKYLNENNVTTRRGGVWHRSTIQNILRSEYVKGNTIWSGEVIENTHEAIVSEEVSEEAEQTIKDRSKRIRTSALNSDFLFSGLLQCNSCGHNLHGNFQRIGHRTYYMYSCSRRVIGKCDGENTSVSETPLEKQFVEQLKKIDMTDVINDIEIEVKKGNSLDDIKKEIKSIEERKKKWQFAWVNELITDDDLKVRMAEEEIKEKEAMEKLDVSKKEEPIKYNENEIKELLYSVKENWNHLTRKEKKRLIHSFVKKVSYAKDGRSAILTDIEYIV